MVLINSLKINCADELSIEFLGKMRISLTIYRISNNCNLNLLENLYGVIIYHKQLMKTN